MNFVLTETYIGRMSTEALAKAMRDLGRMQGTLQGSLADNNDECLQRLHAELARRSDAEHRYAMYLKDHDPSPLFADSGWIEPMSFDAWTEEQELQELMAERPDPVEA